jgi:hypothetical protein
MPFGSPQQFLILVVLLITALAVMLLTQQIGQAAVLAAPEGLAPETSPGLAHHLSAY